MPLFGLDGFHSSRGFRQTVPRAFSTEPNRMAVLPLEDSLFDSCQCFW